MAVQKKEEDKLKKEKADQSAAQQAKKLKHETKKAEKEAKKEAKKAAKAAAKMEELKQNGQVAETVSKLQGFMNEQGVKNKEIAEKSVDVMK